MKITIDNMSNVYKAGKASVDTMELKGYELVKEVMVDNSGFGADNEYADTATQFETRLQQLLHEHGKLTAKITGVGQFQVYVGLFKKTGKSKVKKIDNNTLLINNDDGTRAVRLHDTDILVERNGYVYFDNGGYATRTTHDRMNKYANAGVRSKDFETLVNDTPIDNGKTRIKGALKNV